MDPSSLSILTSFFPQAGHAPAARPGATPPSASPRQTSPAPRQAVPADRVTIRSGRPEAVVARQRAEQAVIERLRTRDREVRAHEQAHVARAGGLAKGGPTFQFQRGPDGRLYAVAGSVEIDVSPVPGNPQATIQKARQIRAAALAPARPSAQDRAVAAAAVRMEAQARVAVDQLQRSALGAAAGPSRSGSLQDQTSVLARHLDVFA